MKYSKEKVIIIMILVMCNFVISQDTISRDNEGAFYKGVYPDLFSQLLNKSGAEINHKLEKAFNQLFYGDDNQRIYFPVVPDMAYIEDILHKDVRSEGMSYGMMIAVQLNRKQEFDRLWKWAKTFMQHKDGPAKDYFAWQLNRDGSIIDSTTASDGDEWIAMALFFASARWGDGAGIFNYNAEAQQILKAMLNKIPQSTARGTITGMFDKIQKQVVFVPEIPGSGFTDPSYHLPHFYELWGKWAESENQFWLDAADTSRAFLKRAVHPVTGLTPDYANFDGSPYSPWNGGNENFQYDAWRVAANIAVDYTWFARDEWQVEQSNRLLNFFYSKGIGSYGNRYTLDGKKLQNDYSTGLVAMNAAAALASTNENRKEFVEELWNAEIPHGLYRYYDGLLYMLGLLQVSGNYQIYKPGEINPESIK